MTDPRILIGDCRKTLQTRHDASVHCCVTSPPYYGLRDYGTATWQGGDPDCGHKQSTARNDGGRSNADGFHGSTAADSDKGAMNYPHVCGKCGAKRIDSQIGLEQTPDEYVAQLVGVFREVWRVLRDDGTVWLNLGDSYGTGTTAKRQQSTNPGVGANTPEAQNSVGRCGGYAKQLIGIPWRVAFALQADGWYLRQDIIWHKPNPMPESVRDRCTKAHEYIFLLSKQARYYYDAEAIKEPGRDWGTRDRKAGSAFVDGTPGRSRQSGGTNCDFSQGRNRRSVWTVTTKPYKGAHFATFPPDLIEPCILAGCPEGGTVLDPFGGSGTTAAVAIEHGRDYIICELNAEYVHLAEERIGRAQKARDYEVAQGKLFTEIT